jgi:hypothetical protein
MDGRARPLTPGRGTRAGYDGAKRQRGSEAHMAVNTLGHLLARHLTAADVGDREAGARLVADTQDATDDAVSIADVDQGDTSATAAVSAAVKGIKLEVVKRPEAKAGLRASALC